MRPSNSVSRNVSNHLHRGVRLQFEIDTGEFWQKWGLLHARRGCHALCWHDRSDNTGASLHHGSVWKGSSHWLADWSFWPFCRAGLSSRCRGSIFLLHNPLLSWLFSHSSSLKWIWALGCQLHDCSKWRCSWWHAFHVVPACRWASMLSFLHALIIRTSLSVAKSRPWRLSGEVPNL